MGPESKRGMTDSSSAQPSNRPGRQLTSNLGQIGLYFPLSPSPVTPTQPTESRGLPCKCSNRVKRHRQFCVADPWPNHQVPPDPPETSAPQRNSPCLLNGTTSGTAHEHPDRQTSSAHSGGCRQQEVSGRIGRGPASGCSWTPHRRTMSSQLQFS